MSIYPWNMPGAVLQVVFASPRLKQQLQEQLPSLLQQHQQLQQKVYLQAEREYQVVAMEELLTDQPTTSSKSNIDGSGAAAEAAAAAADPPAIGPHTTASLGRRRSPGRTALLLLSVLLQTDAGASKQEMLQMLAGE
jgi:hypothetical protein